MGSPFRPECSVRLFYSTHVVNNLARHKKQSLRCSSKWATGPPGGRSRELMMVTWPPFPDALYLAVAALFDETAHYIDSTRETAEVESTRIEGVSGNRPEDGAWEER
jgi:hypothetical protein